MRGSPGNSSAAAVTRAATVLLFLVLPLIAVALAFSAAVTDLGVPDFELAFYGAAEAILAGDSPYPLPDDPEVRAGIAYVYPPLTALATIPFTLIPVDVARLVVMALLCLGVGGTLLALGIRDWRCYGLAFLWPPVLSAIQTGNITIPLALAAALVWRWRERPSVSSLSLGVSLAAKVILWPLLVWLAATRKLLAAGLALAVGVAALVVSWAAIGFVGVREYPDLVRRLQELEEPLGYTVYALALDVGASDAVARLLWLAVAVGLLGGVVLLARRGDERRAFVLAVAAALACSPIVWLHYFALLLVAVAVAEPKLGPVWFVPLAMYASTGTHNGTTAQTAITIAAAALTVAVALRPAGVGRRRLLTTTSPAGGRP